MGFDEFPHPWGIVSFPPNKKELFGARDDSLGWFKMQAFDKIVLSLLPFKLQLKKTAFGKV
ncbi:MAG: hypothetical protein WCJ29_02120 [bacterium]